MNKNTYPIGSVSHGTMRPQDLFEAFTSELQSLNPKRYEEFTKLYPIVFAIEDYDNMNEYEEEGLEYANEELIAILCELSGPYFYFGAHPGDGADYGFWFDEDLFEDDCRYGTVLKVNNLSEVEFEAGTFTEEHEYVAVVSDHGNITLYDLQGEEVWSIV